ncbi:hypothetical protein D7X55_25960 [Corallococcus sp. AB049A]|uniref:DUF4345 domain-containing protein n=1 Tax=Corallococcus interemptor TaxID=2316720 RepID=A0A3A8QXR7_9BACT|nr:MULTISPECIES: hypothetical protein [Corallococcus]RKH39742.1 hypothetical protein D7Y23_35885 [Corallococcus sp. AB050B]RKH73357.1 hypothetical protein D7X96_02885 [Corallococcus interemptor]RKI59252.1 hypothetical protein D7X55_25960 [Corallococcus sp. AB049A]
MFINPDYPLASWFLAVSTSVFLVVYALPLTFIPLRWARWFGWELPTGNNDLTVYFARCLGGLALSVIIAVVQFIPDPKSHLVIFELIGLIGGIMTAVHIWGWVRKQQPWLETAEIPLYGAMCLGALYLRYAHLS